MLTKHRTIQTITESSFISSDGYAYGPTPFNNIFYDCGIQLNSLQIHLLSATTHMADMMTYIHTYVEFSVEPLLFTIQHRYPPSA